MERGQNDARQDPETRTFNGLSGTSPSQVRTALPSTPPVTLLRGEIMFSRIAPFVYGSICYLVFFATLVYSIGFLANSGVPRPMDSAPQLPFLEALAIDAALLTIFALQHSVMAREWFKKAWTRIVPTPVERSTYVLFSSVAMILLFWKWQPIAGVVWEVTSTPMRVAVLTFYAAGWVILFAATFLINHFDLFGLRQVWLYLTGRPYTQLKFRTPAENFRGYHSARSSRSIRAKPITSRAYGR